MNATMTATMLPQFATRRIPGPGAGRPGIPWGSPSRLWPGRRAASAPEAALYLLGRQALGDQLVRLLLAEEPEAQVVVLDAGDDMTGCRIGAERRIAGCAPGRFFEVDRPEAIAAKCRSLDRLRGHQAIHDRHVARVAFDANRVSLASGLLDAGFDRTLPVLWLFAGDQPMRPSARAGYRLRDLSALSAQGARMLLDVDGFGVGAEAVGGWLQAHGWRLEQRVDPQDMAFPWEDSPGVPAPASGIRGRLYCVAGVHEP